MCSSVVGCLYVRLNVVFWSVCFLFVLVILVCDVLRRLGCCGFVIFLLSLCSVLFRRGFGDSDVGLLCLFGYDVVLCLVRLVNLGFYIVFYYFGVGLYVVFWGFC